MRIVFWENIISQHKIDYWYELSRQKDVSAIIIVIDQELDDELKSQGWFIEDEKLKNIVIKVHPKVDDIQTLFSSNLKNTFHIFSGIKANKFVYESFLISLDYNIHRILLTESVNLNKERVITRRLASFMIERKYLKYYDIVLGSGTTTKKWYLENGLHPENFYSFLYSINNSLNDFNLLKNNSSDTYKFVFVGQLIKRKGIDLLLKALGLLTSNNWKLDIFGTGSELDSLKRLTIKQGINEKVHFKGVLPNSVMKKHLKNYDTLVLPSRFDGWGAVINEAISSGLKVICSNRCGASQLVINEKIGNVFNIKNTASLKEQLKSHIENGHSFEDRKYVLNYQETINGLSTANYLIRIINYHYDKTNIYPNPPWLKLISKN